jgi:parallel beta-helix repeat protein
MTRSVNCDEGQSIQAVLETATTRADRLEVLVTGTCNEDVTIRRSPVTIDGGGNAVIVGEVAVMADNVWLYGLTVTGPGRGVNVGAGGYARIWDVDLVGNESDGLRVSSNSSVWVRRGEISNNEGVGIIVESSSQIRLQDTPVGNNASHGVMLVFNSQADISGCEISQNGEHGIELDAGSQANIDNNSIHENASHGVIGWLDTVLVLHGNDIANNGGSGVVGFGRTTIQIGGAQINYNGDDGIGLSAGSTLILEDPATTLIGNTNAALWCGDAQSYVNDLSLLDTAGDKSCSEFGWPPPSP